MTQPNPEELPAAANEQPTVIQEPDQHHVRDVRSTTPRPALPNTLPPVLPGDGTAPLPLSRIGEYEILSTVGRGGMGVVFKARHVLLGREVALKMLSSGLLARPEDVHRFENEAAAAAQLQHPNIVALYEVGNFEGQPYFCMEFVHGSSLAQRVALGPLPGRLAASYLERVARAVHYAHSRGIIHRDLKPANILLDENDQPKISDFGLAKLLRGDSGQTRTGTVMGTPSYMAPEQANARKDVGPAYDVYSLGAILYELMTGRPPFQGETALDTLRRVANDEPTPPHLHNQAVDRDLETICLKCLEKEPGRRYASAAALADDLARYLSGEPITARRLGPARRTLKWVQRKPATAALLFVTLASLIGFALFEWHVAEREHQLRKDAETQTLRAEAQKKLAEAQKKEAEKEKEKADKAHEEVLVHEKILRHYLYDAEMGQIQRAWENADLKRARFLLDGWLPQEGKKDLRQWEWYFLRSLCQAPRAWQAHAERVNAAAYRPDGKRLASAGGPIGKPGQVKIWDTATGKLLSSFPQKHTKPITALAFSPNGQLLATASRDHTVLIWDAATAAALAVLKGHTDAVTSVAFSADGNLLASGDADARILIWDLSKSGASPQVQLLKGHAGEVTGLAFHPTVEMLASSSTDETVRLWDAATGKLLKSLRGQQGEVTCVAFHPLGKQLFSGGGPGPLGGQVKRWDVASGKELQSHDGLSEKVLALAVSKLGHIAAAGKDGFVFLWDERQSTEPARFRADTKPVYGMTFSPNGKRLATAGGGGQVRVWNSTGGTETMLLPGPQRTNAVAFSAKGGLLAAVGWSPGEDGAVYMFDAKAGWLKDVLRYHAGKVHAVAFSADEKWLATGGEDQTVRLYELGKGAPPLTLKGHQGRVLAVAFHPDGTLLASAAAEEEDIILWDIPNGKEKVRLKGHGNGVLVLAFSPDGKFLASGGYDKTVRLWDLEKNSSLPLTSHSGTIRALAFSPDSSQVASAGIDQTILVWNVDDGKEFLKLEGSPGPITGLAWHPRGQRLASVGPDRTVHLWDLITSKEVLQLHGPPASLSAVAFSPDGWQLAAAGDYPGIHVWDARAGQ